MNKVAYEPTKVNVMRATLFALIFFIVLNIPPMCFICHI